MGSGIAKEYRMNAPVAVPAEAAGPSSPDPAAFEFAELELSLALADTTREDFATTVRAALASAEGLLLFIMPAPDGAMVAASRIGSAGAQRIVLLVLDSQDGQISIEPGETSSHPLAGLAMSYAGVMDHLPAIAA